MEHQPALVRLQVLLLLLPFLLFRLAVAEVHYQEWVVAPTSYTRLCRSNDILTINGQLPGPTLYVHRGDTVIINSYNHANYSVTIHWHGLKQPRNPWSDGTEFVTMCGVPPGKNFTYTLLFTTEEGTIWYHAHSEWTRATVYGAIVVYPKMGATYPFPKPDSEYVVVIGEWWNSDIMDVFVEGVTSGTDFNVSDAYTINGQPGDLYECSQSETSRFVVEYGKTYLFRVVNAVMSFGMFVGIANHTLTVVGRDGAYLKPFEREFVLLNVGQTIDILVTANQSQGLYYMATDSYKSIKTSYDANKTTAVVEYRGYNSSLASSPPLPYLPSNNDTAAVYEFSESLRSLASEEHPIDVPMEIDTRLVMTMSLNEEQCNASACSEGYKLAASMNNISFLNPRMDILSAYYESIKNVYTTDFPAFPPYMFNFTADTYSNDLLVPVYGTRALVVKYNSSVELVLQGTKLLLGDYHPTHLHGYHFYAVGQGFGNFDPVNDPLNYNLVNPPKLNTIDVPFGGWAALRFRADNPGVWFLHCHLERHFSWGMTTVLIVTDGPNPETSILPPPTGMPNCSDRTVHITRDQKSNEPLEDGLMPAVNVNGDGVDASA
ncbi:laccase-14-like [Nymphaea colorata]|nr:laccase-14-like [Nymphaea colorata]